MRFYRVRSGADKLLYQRLWLEYFCTVPLFFLHGGIGKAENCQSGTVFCGGRRFRKGIKESSHRNGMEDGDAYLDSGFPK